MTCTDFAGTVAIVTGAGGGIGAAVVRALADRGGRVAAVDRDGAALQALIGTGSPVLALPADVTDADQVEAAVEAAERRLGPVDHLVNVAGVLHPGPVLRSTVQDWDRTFAVNARAVYLCSVAAARRMVGRRRGSIVTVTSNAASVPRTHLAAYGASKAAATAFTKTLGLELAGHGIRCNVVAPGSTDTSMLRSLWTDDSGPEHSLHGDLAEFRVGIPSGRIGRPDDVAEAVLFLLSERAAQITMHDLYVDGGAALGR